MKEQIIARLAKVQASDIQDDDFASIEREIMNLYVFSRWKVRVISAIYGSDGLVINISTPKPVDPRNAFDWTDAKRDELEAALKQAGYACKYVGLAAAQDRELAIYFEH